MTKTLKMRYSLLIILPIITLLAVACSPADSGKFDKEIAAVREKHITDKRLVYWDVNAVLKDGKIILSGSTSSSEAFVDLENMAKQNQLEFNAELLPQTKFAENPWAIVTLSVCNIRSQPSHAAEMLTQSILGTPVKVYKEDDGWYLVQTPDQYFGWVDGAGIALKTLEELADWKTLNKVLYAKQSGLAYQSNTVNSPVEFDLVLGDLLSVEETIGGFYKVILPDGRSGFVSTNDCISLDVWKEKSVSIEKLLQVAFSLKGVPYMWGGTSAKMMDCSGFTKTVFYMQGLILQRDASQQTLYGELVDTSRGYEQLQPGDLLFFGRKASADQQERVTHVGFYTGNMKFIHESGKVRINSLDTAGEDYTEYYEKAFVRARRIIGNVDGQGIEWITDNEFYKQIL